MSQKSFLKLREELIERIYFTKLVTPKMIGCMLPFGLAISSGTTKLDHQIIPLMIKRISKMQFIILRNLEDRDFQEK